MKPLPGHIQTIGLLAPEFEIAVIADDPFHVKNTIALARTYLIDKVGHKRARLYLTIEETDVFVCHKRGCGSKWYSLNLKKDTLDLIFLINKKALEIGLSKTNKNFPAIITKIVYLIVYFWNLLLLYFWYLKESRRSV